MSISLLLYPFFKIFFRHIPLLFPNRFEFILVCMIMRPAEMAVVFFQVFFGFFFFFFFIFFFHTNILVHKKTFCKGEFPKQRGYFYFSPYHIRNKPLLNFTFSLTLAFSKKTNYNIIET